MTRASFGSDWNEVLRNWAAGGQVNATAKEGWAALGALERMRPTYLADAFVNQPRWNVTLSNLVAHGADLLACEAVPRIERLVARLDAGDRGAWSELRAAALFCRLGFSPVLEPELGGKALDLSIEANDEVVYVEVVGPTLSDATRESMGLLQTAADALRQALEPGRRLAVTFLSAPSDTVVAEVEAALAHLPEREIRRIGDVAIAQLTPYAPSPGGDSTFDYRITGPAATDISPASMGVVSFDLSGATSRLVDARAEYFDPRAQRLLAAELHHFSRNERNILLIDYSDLPAVPAVWVPLLRRAFQPARNTRLGAVVLLSVKFDWVLVPSVLEGHVLVNPYAARPPSEGVLERISSGLVNP